MGASRYREIDFLRAYAIIYVIFLHVVKPVTQHIVVSGFIFKYLDFGTGVDIFFAISGFVIARSVSSLWVGERRAFSVATCRLVLSFYRKRFLRLWPAAAVCLFYNFLATWVFGLLALWTGREQSGWPNPLESAWRFIAGLVYVYNFYEMENPSWLGYLWSLSVEWQFYIIFPILLIFFRNNLWRSLVLVCLFLVLFFVQPGGVCWWMFRCDGIIFGVLAYIWASGSRADTRGGSNRFRQALGKTTSTIALLLIPLLPATVFPQRTGIAAVSFLAAGLVLMARADRGYIPTFGLCRIITWIGNRSYSLYLVHLPVFLTVENIYFQVWGVSSFKSLSFLTLLLIIIVCLGLSAAVAELLYRSFERPFQILSHSIPLRV